MTRKWLAIGLVVLVSAPMIATATPTHEEEAISLTVWSHDHPPATAIFNDKIIPAFEAQYPSIDVTYTIAATTVAEVQSKLVVATQADAGPDICTIGDGVLDQHIYLGNAVPVDLDVFGVSSMEEWGALWDGGHAVMMRDGVYYGVASETSTFCMVINAQHFRDAGLDPDRDYPLTWLEGDRSVAHIAQLLTQREGDKIIREGYGLSIHPTGALLNYYSMLGSLGKELLTPDGNSTNLASPESQRVFQMLDDLTNKYQVSLPGGSGREAMKREAFQNGSASMITTVFSWYQAVLEDYPEIYQDGEGVRFVPMPRFADGEQYSMKYGGLRITLSQSDHQREAWMFQKSIMDFAGEFLAAGIFVPVAGFADSEAAKRMRGFEVFRDMLSWPGSVQIRTNEAGSIFAEALTRVLMQDADIQSTLIEADAQMKEYLASLPY